MNKFAGYLIGKLFYYKVVFLSWCLSVDLTVFTTKRVQCYSMLVTFKLVHLSMLFREVEIQTDVSDVSTVSVNI